MIDPDTRPEVIAAAAARIADLARRDLDTIYTAREDLDTIYTAREATTLAHVHAACEVSRALAAAAEAIAYVADPEADPGRTHVVVLPEGSKVVGDVAYAPSIPTEQPEGWCTDCEPGPEEPEQHRDSYLCRWCGDDLSERPDPPATEATCVYRIGGGARPGGCTATILAVRLPDEAGTLVACTQDAGHEGQHIGSVAEHDPVSHVVWSDGARGIHRPTGSRQRGPTVPPAGVTTASAERPTRVVFGPFDDQADPPRPPEPRPDGLVRPFDTAFDPAPSPSPLDDCGEVCPESLAPRGEGGIACRRITGHPGEHQGSTRVSIVRWTTDGVSVRYGAGAS